jgi:hypothetical protein
MFRFVLALILVATLTVVLAIPALAFDLAGIFHRGERGNGDLVAVPFDLAPCTEVILKCGLDVDVTFGSEQKVTLRMDENLVPAFAVEAHGGVLTIDADDNPRPSRHTCLEVTLRALDRLTVDGAGDITIRGYDGKRLVLAVDGAGDLEVDGKAGELVVSVNGAGDIDARRLEARAAEVSVNGAGDVTVTASERAEVEINGVGDVDVYGDPADFTQSVHGIGDISRR